MLPGKQYLAPGRDRVRPSNKSNAKVYWLDEHDPDSVAIDMASATRTSTPQHCDQDHPGGVRTGSTLVVAEVSHPDDEERTGNSFGSICTVTVVKAMSNFTCFAAPLCPAAFAVYVYPAQNVLACCTLMMYSQSSYNKDSSTKPSYVYRQLLDDHGTYHHHSCRVWSFVSGMGNVHPWVDCWTCHPGGILCCHLVHSALAGRHISPSQRFWSPQQHLLRSCTGHSR